ncbi:hypothetical protein R1flu_001992 [Riccia fluitans]|uniref:Uncharacterized protein n=1 Tax=Riccia fluitans TaxID=41844 RepID=A0ABD1Y7T6_9MARC
MPPTTYPFTKGSPPMSSKSSIQAQPSIPCRRLSIGIKLSVPLRLPHENRQHCSSRPGDPVSTFYRFSAHVRYFSFFGSSWCS